MVVTADERTSVFGNFHVVTGTYTAGGGVINLAGQFSSVHTVVATPNQAAPIAEPEQVSTQINTAGGVLLMTITSAAGAQAGTWMAIGRR